MSSSEAGAFLFGIWSGAVVMAVLAWVFHDAPKSSCAETHNVYACEWIAAPMEAQANDQS